MGHTLMENRSGLIVQADLTQADGHAERRAALAMIHRHAPGSTRRLTLGADKGYDSADFVADLRQAWRHPACRPEGTALRHRRTHHPPRRLRLLPKAPQRRSRNPSVAAKTIGGMAQTVYRGVERVRARFTLTMAALQPRPTCRACWPRDRGRSGAGRRDRSQLQPSSPGEIRETLLVARTFFRAS